MLEVSILSMEVCCSKFHSAASCLQWLYVSNFNLIFLSADLCGQLYCLFLVLVFVRLKALSHGSPTGLQYIPIIKLSFFFTIVF